MELRYGRVTLHKLGSSEATNVVGASTVSFSEAAPNGVEQVASRLGELAWEAITGFNVQCEGGAIVDEQSRFR